ncbi:MAG: PhzF family phenazine biosynthesis protein [Acidobacteria bacterium]|nr:PhzF family phenazine biosynthesis protein [Acidobacteriota bacterium]
MANAPNSATQLEYHIVDVFTDTALMGNGLAVVFDTIGLSTERMQAIAREFNLSETTFIQRRDISTEKQEGVRVRIFTTQEELPFAGHPTLGTASVLKLHAPEVLADDTIRLALKVGTVPVRFHPDTLFGQMTQRDPEFGRQLDTFRVAQLCGLHAEDLHATVSPQVVSTGTAFAIVALRYHEPLARLRVDQELATQYLREHGGRWFYVMGPTGSSNPSWRARMQFYGGEDPATGSAAGCAISYLVGHSLVATGQQIHVQQGVEIGRTSDLFLAADASEGKVTNVRVAGSTVPVAKGTIFLP